MNKIITPNAPLFRDPIYDGAADPVIIWNKQEKSWWIFYTNRRASCVNYGVSFVHGTDIGIASSNDYGRTWIYRGIAQGLQYEKGRNTYWAPEIIEHEGIYHMYVSYVRGIPCTWDQPRTILHYTSDNLWDWEFDSPLSLSSNKVIDACVILCPDGRFKMWYKDEIHDSHTYTAYSDDLYSWTVGGPEITDCPHEGPNVFLFKNHYWMITDPWEGLGVYRSDDLQHWERCPNILNQPGNRTDDGAIGSHGDVLVHRGHAYIFYFTHPEASHEGDRCSEINSGYHYRRSSIQAAELFLVGNHLECDRDNVALDLEY
ncbi:glycosyl hydrolase [Blautia liquoris]|uniref:Glycosyl hydrolase n=1 Tax=Blautia liquoris TaxID=2779518 RepID=A0A7M2REJ2_9FIRM|nr:glycosyl hydrolase [Blautia liquoris]QOV18755.1 glycosyl hydrolase [Blautia liquoris]